MGFEKYDEVISKAEQEVNRIKQTAENLIPNFQQVIQTYLTEFANYVVNQAVTDNPDTVTSLGEKRSELKKAIAEIISTFPDECAKHLGNVEWGHRSNIQGGSEIDTFSVPRNLQVKTNSSIDGEIRQLIGKVGSLLIKYGLAKSGNEWQSKSGNTYYAYGLPDHNYGLQSAGQLGQLKQQYAGIIDELVKATKVLRKAELDKKVAEAKSLWESE